MDRLCQSIMQSISLKNNNTLTSACMQCYSICLKMTKLAFATEMKNTIFSLSLIKYSRTTVSKKKQTDSPFRIKYAQNDFARNDRSLKFPMLTVFCMLLETGHYYRLWREGSGGFQGITWFLRGTGGGGGGLVVGTSIKRELTADEVES